MPARDLDAGNRIEVWSWVKRGSVGKRNLWTVNRWRMVLAPGPPGNAHPAYEEATGSSPRRARWTSPTSGGITLQEVGSIMNLTRERIRQIAVRELLKLKMMSPSPAEVGALHWVDED